MEFLKEHLWSIFEVASEERTDGDNFKGDMSLAHNLFLTSLTPEGKQYQCMAGLDKPALLEEWEAIEDKQAEFDAYHALVTAADGGHYKELTAAFTAGDREVFEHIVAEA